MSVGVFDSQFRVAVRSLAASAVASLFSRAHHDCITCGMIPTPPPRYFVPRKKTSSPVIMDVSRIPLVGRGTV